MAPLLGMVPALCVPVPLFGVGAAIIGGAGIGTVGGVGIGTIVGVGTATGAAGERPIVGSRA